MSVNSLYVDGVVKLHNLRESIRDALNRLREAKIKNHVSDTLGQLSDRVAGKFVAKGSQNEIASKYAHVFRRKTRWELIMLSGTVCGIELCYSAETAFVSPTYRELGLDVKYVSMLWCISPILGFFLTPLLGSLSDSCRSSLGRRRPFILLFSVGIILGLLLVPNGELLGQALGDDFRGSNKTSAIETSQKMMDTSPRPWGMFFTVMGTILLDFCSDGCQSPARAYLLDVTVPEDHKKGLSTFSMIAGFGGIFGYMMGAINWEQNGLGNLMGSQLRAVFTLVTVIFIICLLISITSFTEIPLTVLQDSDAMDQCNKVSGDNYKQLQEEKEENYLLSQQKATTNGQTIEHFTLESAESQPTLKQYLVSIIRLPRSLAILCLTNLFCWMALVSYSLYFTNFVGEVVFAGDPESPVDSPQYERYKEGVRFGCWGMTVYSLTCSCYSLVVEKLVKRFGAKTVYIISQLSTSVGMMGMALWRRPAAVICLSTAIGIMYGTIFTMPFLLTAHYHELQNFGTGAKGEVRGIGTDLAIVNSMVFVAQFLLSTVMGSLISAFSTSTVSVWSSALLSLCGAACATQVLYLDL